MVIKAKKDKTLYDLVVRRSLVLSEQARLCSHMEESAVVQPSDERAHDFCANLGSSPFYFRRRNE